MSTYSFRHIASSWGVHIDLDARLRPDSPPSHDAIEFSPGLFLKVSDNACLGRREVSFLCSGLRRVSEELRAHSGGDPLVVELLDVTINSTDYQPEGMEAAIIGWAAETLGFGPPLITIRFDRELNRYLFEYE